MQTLRQEGHTAESNVELANITKLVMRIQNHHKQQRQQQQQQQQHGQFSAPARLSLLGAGYSRLFFIDSQRICRFRFLRRASNHQWLRLSSHLERAQR